MRIGNFNELDQGPRRRCDVAVICYDSVVVVLVKK